MEEEYKLPDPKTNPVAAIVLSYKTFKGVQFDDRDWDIANWSRASKASRLLLDICKGFEQAERCLSYVAEQFNGANLAWTLETITKHAHDWIQKNGSPYGTNARKRLFDAIAKQRSAGRPAPQGELATAGEVLASLGNFEVIQSSEQDSETGRGRGHVSMPRRMDGKQGQRQPEPGIDDSTEDTPMGSLGA